MNSFEPIGRGWGGRFSELVRNAREQLLICSPFITRGGVALVASNLSEKLREEGSLVFLTDLSPLSACEGATDPRAIEELAAVFRTSSLFHLSRLHAKVYIADSKQAIVTSGNLTSGGIYNNFEYGLFIDHAPSIEMIRKDMLDYAQLGALLDRSAMGRYCDVVDRARRDYLARQAELGESTRDRVRNTLRDAEDELIRSHLAGGAVHTVFAKTILYLLRRSGPLSTEELHPLIEGIHPDLCDNTVDRIIDGKHFGKKWKHAVRTAQQFLKRRGAIELHGGKWTLRAAR